MYRVVMIDDEPWARRVVKNLVDWEAMELEIVGEASDGTEGLEMIASLHPDIVLTDMRMPGIDGVGLLKAVNEQYSDILLIAMSGYNDFIYLKQAIRSRVIEYLLKPVDPKELNKALKKCIEELNTSRKDALSGFGTLHLFKNQKIMQQYLEYRQQIFQCLMTLNYEKAEEEFKGLEGCLNANKKNVSREMATKIGHDFIQMLEEYIAKSEMNIETILLDESSKSILEKDTSRVEDGFLALQQFYSNAIKRMIQQKKRKQQLDIHAITTYIDRHYQESISLESIASQFYVSKEHLSRTFKNSQKITLNEYIIKVRMIKAKELITLHNVAIKDVAALVGYNDIAYFYRVFKKYYGHAPGELREQTNINKVQ